MSKCDIGWFANGQHNPALSFTCTNLYILALFPDHGRRATCHDRRLSRAPSEHSTKEHNQNRADNLNINNGDSVGNQGNTISADNVKHSDVAPNP
jgi:hypothetical protein